ncbi:CRISPR-associated endonuclease Cas2 [Candidatus Micrarchaeota archaeon]|nr:MAG: CRISPR-associated endonuclease Cas2 [Candidatus Micrarchaeota archaeon]
MIYWVIYDITDNKVRSKVAEECKNLGLHRVQKSSFIGILSRNTAEMLYIKIGDLIDKRDCVFFIPQCNKCFADKLILGDFDERTVEAKDFIVVQ